MSDNKYIFSISETQVLDGRPIGALKPNADGYYTHPVAVINHQTENDTFYTPEIFLKHLTDSSGFFKKTLDRGALHGESDHPKLTGTSNDVSRLLSFDRDRISHHFRKIWTIPHPSIANAFIVMAELKPCGEKGQWLKEELDDPHRNSAFSLRSLVREHMKGRLRMRDMIQLVTFDSVTVPGSYEATKRWSNIGTESYSLELTPDMLSTVASQHSISSVGFESITDGTLLDFLGALEVKIKTTTYDLSGFRSMGKDNIIDRRTLDNRSISHIGMSMNGGIR